MRRLLQVTQRLRDPADILHGRRNDWAADPGQASDHIHKQCPGTPKLLLNGLQVNMSLEHFQLHKNKSLSWMSCRTSRAARYNHTR
jgi:hypothetical protein